MKFLFSFSLLLLIISCGKKAEKPVASADDFVNRHLVLLDQYAGCATAAPEKLWCRAAAFSKAAEFPAPAPGVYLGVTTFVQTSGGSADSLEKFSRLSSLAVKESGKNSFALIATINPRNVAGKEEVNRLIPLVKQQIAGGKKPKVQEPGLTAYLESLPARATYPLNTHGAGFVIAGGSRAELRRVGNTWISAEVPQNNPAGIWLTIFAAE